MSVLEKLREICEKAEKSWDVLRLTPPEVLALIDALEECRETLEFYGNADNYRNGSGACPDVECVGGELIEYDYPAIGGDDRGENARNALQTIEEKLKGLG